MACSRLVAAGRGRQWALGAEQANLHEVAMCSGAECYVLTWSPAPLLSRGRAGFLPVRIPRCGYLGRRVSCSATKHSLVTRRPMYVRCILSESLVPESRAFLGLPTAGTSRVSRETL